MKFVLEANVVTFNSKRQVLRQGYVVVDDQRIVHVGSRQEGIPTRFKEFTQIETDGYIYPGLIDLHNHLPYNFLNLWHIVRKFEDRYQWPRLSKYKTEISAPTKLLASSNAAELVKYAECKALVAGVTSIDGFSKFNKSYAAWLLRNVEVEPFGKLEPKIYQSVLKIKNEEEFHVVDRKMNEGNAFIYHLAEGTSQELISEYSELEKHGLIRDKLVGIHCTALNADNWEVLGKNKVKLVWSPLSNLLLYGKTADVASAKKNKVIISLGSDWTPTGSKNLLWELKVADLYNINSLDKLFSNLELAEMVTLNPAEAIGVADQIGSIQVGLFADLVIFDNLDSDPYRNLIQCTEKNLNLSIIGGRPRYGKRRLLSQLGISKIEKIKIGSLTRGIDILEPGVEYGEITFRQVWSKLKEALANPATTAKRLFNISKTVTSREEAPLRLIIEDEVDDMNEPLKLSAAMTLESFVKSNFETDKLPSLVLDSLTMQDEDDFFPSLKVNPNIPSYLSDLKNYLI
jgi:5-methylthioadenosine/S-adenosylhomocysteine deaminase